MLLAYHRFLLHFYYLYHLCKRLTLLDTRKPEQYGEVAKRKAFKDSFSKFVLIMIRKDGDYDSIDNNGRLSY